MQWLIANMWMALAVATVLGLLFGFALRGLLVGSRIRTAEVEREIAKTELNQSKAEVEALFAAQRKQKEDTERDTSDDERLRGELNERDHQIASLQEQLITTQNELETATTKLAEDNDLVENVGAALAGAAVGTVLTDDDQKELMELRDRNTWLEERVGALEQDLAAKPKVEPEDQTAIAISEEDTVAIEKTRWRADYLTLRVGALEEKLIDLESRPVEPLPELEPEPIEEPVVETRSGADEELAQLRWRNRYLEGRLAYFEQEAEEEVIESAEASDPEPTEDIVEGTEEGSSNEAPAAEAEVEEDPGDSDAIDDVETESEPELQPELESAEPESVVIPVVEEEPGVHPSEAMLAELDGKQPTQLDRPRDGGDDLTAITGIGPRIAEVLNGLGIWTYAQIAGWEPEHETWIENHLSFKGRVSRENWVGQAKNFVVVA